jgi:hypothetical protein
MQIAVTALAILSRGGPGGPARAPSWRGDTATQVRTEPEFL